MNALLLILFTPSVIAGFIGIVVPNVSDMMKG